MSDITMTQQAPQGGSDRPCRRPRWLVPADRRDAVTGIALVTPAELWDRLPADLRKDARAVVPADPEDRPDPWRQIRGDAVDGEYEPRVSRIASRLTAWADDLPEALIAGIEQVRLAGGDESREPAEDVVDGALAGKYGPDVGQRAEWLQGIAERRGFDRAAISREG